MTESLGIVVALVLLMALAYKGFSLLILAPLTALLAALLTPGTPLLASYTQVFMPALGGFVVAFFPLFLLGAVFGKLMEDSGAAQQIAVGIVACMGNHRTILAIVLACAVLTYGGVSLFVVAFAVYPIAVALFREADIPKRLMPGTMALGAFTFTMTALPGTPAIQNAIPMPHFGTTPFAAPGLGLIGGGIMALVGVMWLERRAKKAKAEGEGYGCHDEPQALGVPAQELPTGSRDLLLAVAPVALVIVLNYLLSSRWLPAIDTAYLAHAQYGATHIDRLRGVWAVIVALFAGIVLLMVLQRSRLLSPSRSLEQGASASLLPLLNTASQVGFGAVIASLAGFAIIRDAVLAIAPDNPLISLAIAVNILAGITGSASGGMSIALETLGETWNALGQAANIDAELMHRVTTIATGGLDALPHNGAVITLLAICGLSHREAYNDILVVAVVIPLLALAVVVALGSTFGAF